MIGHAFVHSISQNDRGFVNLSGIEEYLRGILIEQRLGAAQLLPAIYGDSIYVPSKVIIMKTNDNGCLYNRRMNGLRTSIEHSFGLFNNLQKILSKTYVLKILNKRGFIVKRILVY